MREPAAKLPVPSMVVNWPSVTRLPTAMPAPLATLKPPARFQPGRASTDSTTRVPALTVVAPV